MSIRVQKGQGTLQHVIDIGPHKLLTDEPPQNGGEDTGPSPHELLAASLGACTALTLTLYARRKQWPLKDVQVHIDHEHQGNVFLLTRHIHYVGDLAPEQRARLTEIANKCPIHKVLAGEISIVTREE